MVPLLSICCMVLLFLGGTHSPYPSEMTNLLKEYSSPSGVVSLSTDRFREFVETAKRRFAFAVLFQASAPHRRCDSCKDVYEEFVHAANSFWATSRAAYTNQMFFGVVDYDDAQEVFEILGFKEVPAILFFPAIRDTALQFEQMNLTKHGYLAEVICDWLVNKSGLKFRIIRSTVLYGTVIFIIIFSVGSIVFYLQFDGFRFLRHWGIWAFLIVVYTLLITSGQVWNHIRNPAFAFVSPSNRLSIVQPHSGSQYVIESYLVFTANVGVTFPIIALMEKSFQPASKRSQKFTIGLLLAIFFNFGLLCAMFKFKSPNYPYSSFSEIFFRFV